MSPQVKPKVFTVAHKPPQPPPQPPPICPTTSLLSFPTTALPHQSQALLITPQSASSRLVTVSIQGLSLAFILPQMLFPQRSTWLPHLPPSSQLQCHLMKEAFPDHSVHLKQHQGFLGGLVVKSAYKAGCMGSIPGTVRSYMPRGN